MPEQEKHTPMDKKFHKTFLICPSCSSPKRFLESLGQEMKDRGLARSEWRIVYELKQGVVADPDRAVLLPIGITIPGFYIATDICMECGTVYAIELTRLEGNTGIMQNRPRLLQEK